MAREIQYQKDIVKEYTAEEIIKWATARMNKATTGITNAIDSESWGQVGICVAALIETEEILNLLDQKLNGKKAPNVL